MPASGVWRWAINTENHLTAYRHREVYRRTWELGAVAGAAGTNTWSRFRFRTGYGVSQIAYVVIMGLDTTGGTAANPRIDITTTLSGGGSTTTQFFYGLSATAGSDGPDELGANRKVVSVSSASVYTVTIQTVDYARPLAVMAYEIGDTTVAETTDYYNTHDPVAGSPIYDADRQRLLQGLSNMYRQNGGIVWHWGLEDGAARTRTSATYINAIDNATTGTPATSDYGVYLNPQYHNTESRTTVPFELAAYGAMNAPACTGNVRLIDSAGNTYGPVAVNSNTDAWFTASINLPTSETFYTIQYAGDGVNQLSLRNVSLIEWE
jgi:hypothetical protein